MLRHGGGLTPTLHHRGLILVALLNRDATHPLHGHACGQGVVAVVRVVCCGFRPTPEIHPVLPVGHPEGQVQLGQGAAQFGDGHACFSASVLSCVCSSTVSLPQNRARQRRPKSSGTSLRG